MSMTVPQNGRDLYRAALAGRFVAALNWKREAEKALSASGECDAYNPFEETPAGPAWDAYMAAYCQFERARLAWLGYVKSKPALSLEPAGVAQ